MPINSFISQPQSFGINAAYRPIVFSIPATDTNGAALPPVVYCDVYFNGSFYKTIANTLADSVNASNSIWSFDIQDTAQEYLKIFSTNNGGSQILSSSNAYAECYCQFRSSVIDVNGFLVADGTAPIQSTGSSAAVSGSGFQSNEFFILNCALQHEDNQDLTAHLNSYKNGTWQPYCFPLTHRPITKIDINQSDYFPVFISSLGASPNDTDVLNNPIIAFRYKYIGQNDFHLINSKATQTGLKGLLNIPSGTKNLAALFPNIYFNQIAEYRVELWQQDGLTLAISNLYQIKRNINQVRIHFVNYLGTVDSINFQLQTSEHQPNSSTWERSESYPLVKSKQSISRYNVTSNDTYTLNCIDYSEKDMIWIDELFDTPVAWIEWSGTQGQSDDLLPITILDTKYQKYNDDRRFLYQVQIQFKFSHERKTIRN